MVLHLVPEPDYRGEQGLAQLRQLQHSLIEALKSEDWLRVRELDRISPRLIERVIEANRDDRSALVQALSELKGVYSNLISRCRSEVSRMAL